MDGPRSRPCRRSWAGSWRDFGSSIATYRSWRHAIDWWSEVRRHAEEAVAQAAGEAAVEVAVGRLLPTEMIAVESMHPDLLFETSNGRLIHLEVHGYGMPDFATSNLLYFALVLRDYKPGVPDGLDFRRTSLTTTR